MYFSYFFQNEEVKMKRFLNGIAAVSLVGSLALLILSADCATGGDCTWSNGDLFTGVATALRPLSSEDPLRWTRR